MRAHESVGSKSLSFIRIISVRLTGVICNNTTNTYYVKWKLHKKFAGMVIGICCKIYIFYIFYIVISLFYLLLFNIFQRLTNTMTNLCSPLSSSFPYCVYTGEMFRCSWVF